MLNIFSLANGRLFQEEIESLEELSRFQPIWVDLESPTPEEKRWVKQYYGLSIPEDARTRTLRSPPVFTRKTTANCTSAVTFWSRTMTSPTPCGWPSF
jgi:magnesium transporter